MAGRYFPKGFEAASCQAVRSAGLGVAGLLFTGLLCEASDGLDLLVCTAFAREVPQFLFEFGQPAGLELERVPHGFFRAFNVAELHPSQPQVKIFVTVNAIHSDRALEIFF